MKIQSFLKNGHLMYLNTQHPHATDAIVPIDFIELSIRYILNITKQQHMLTHFILHMRVK